MATATPVRLGPGGKNFGTFRVEKFSMFDEADLESYADFRNRANDASNGIKIDMMREYSRKITTRHGDGENQTVTTVEEIVLVVQYWEKEPVRDKGDNDDDVKDAAKDWSKGRSLG